MRLFDLLFGCHHKNRSFPITAKTKSPASRVTGTYVVCLDCGREFPYNWHSMKLLPEVAPKKVARFEVHA